MRNRHVSFGLLSVFAMLTVLSGGAYAQRPKGHGVEVATLAGITMLKPSYGDGVTEFGLPTGASVEALLPSLRLTFWSPGSVAVETAVSYAHLSSGDGGSTIFMLEGGPSIALPSSGRTLASLSGLLGAVEVTGGGGGDFYLGSQVILRSRIREHAVSRVQLGVRYFMGDDSSLDYSIEIVGGLGFFL